MLEVVCFIEKETKFDRSGKSGNSHFKSLIKVLDVSILAISRTVAPILEVGGPRIRIFKLSGGGGGF